MPQEFQKVIQWGSQFLFQNNSKFGGWSDMIHYYAK